jgi:2-polyprenyl-3-methyl-5-hydroxy-6-metoxy-1,4-benzoquinol methylase
MREERSYFSLFLIKLAQKKLLSYKFKKIKHCQMCGHPTGKHPLLGMRLNQSQGFHPKSKSGIAVGIKQCTNCALIYSSPQPIPYSLQNHYGTPPDNYWKKEYFNIDPTYFSQQIKMAKELLSFKPGMMALDVGAGIGKTMIALDKAGFDTYGFEPSHTFHEKALEEMHINAEKLKNGAIEEVEYDNDSFDFITFGAVFEHLYEPKYCLEKTMNWLKPGGVIHIEVPSSNWLIAKLINKYYRLRCTNYVTNLSPMHTPYHLFEFDIKSFEKLAKNLNYRIAYHQIDVSTLYFIPKLFQPFLRFFMEKSKTGMQLTVYLQKS